MSTRDISNKRISVWLGLANSVAKLDQPSIVEINAMLNATEAIRWDGFDFGSSESDQIDDRSLADDAGAVLRGFAQFGGAMPFYYPKVTDTASILRQVFNMLKIPRTELIIIERVGFKDYTEPIAAGDNVNVYRIMTDGFNPDTEGEGGYAYVVNMLPKGDVYPWTIVPAATPASVAIVGGAALALTAGQAGLRGATYQGNNIGPRAIWLSSAPNIASVDNRGVILGRAPGTANITATFPGGTASTPVAVTVT